MNTGLRFACSGMSLLVLVRRLKNPDAFGSFSFHFLGELVLYQGGDTSLFLSKLECMWAGGGERTVSYIILFDRKDC